MNRTVYYLHAVNNIKLELGFNNAPMHCRAANSGSWLPKFALKSVALQTKLQRVYDWKVARA